MWYSYGFVSLNSVNYVMSLKSFVEQNRYKRLNQKLPKLEIGKFFFKSNFTLKYVFL